MADATPDQLIAFELYITPLVEGFVPAPSETATNNNNSDEILFDAGMK